MFLRRKLQHTQQIAIVFDEFSITAKSDACVLATEDIEFRLVWHSYLINP
jgi:hypothetical protein